MGCDIHIEVFVKCKDGSHKHIAPPPRWMNPREKMYSEYWLNPSWPDSRDYAAFGLLAGVRHGYGTKFVPQRGLPEFLEGKDTIQTEDVFDNLITLRLYLGDHSFTWMTLAELESISWDEYIYKENGEPEFKGVFIPMLNKLHDFGVDKNNIIVVMGFDS